MSSKCSLPQRFGFKWAYGLSLGQATHLSLCPALMGIGSGFDLGGSCMLLGGGGRVLNLFPRGVSCLRSPSSWPPSPSAVLPAAAEMLSVWAFCLSAPVGQSELCSCCRLLGHSRPRAVPEHACLLLPQGPRLHHGMKPAGRQRLHRSGLRGEGMGA